MGDIDLSGITQTMTQSEAIAEFWVPSGLEDFHSDDFDRPGFWAVAMTWGEADSAIYLGKTIDDIDPYQLSYSAYGVNFDPMGDSGGTQKFESISEEGRLILYSHPDENSKEFCDVFIKIK